MSLSLWRNKYSYPTVDLERVEKILKYHDEGKTLARIGLEFGITRQRVEQIYKKATGGQSWAGDRRRLDADRRKIEAEIEIKKVRGYCRQCHKPLTQETTGSRRSFCSPKCDLIYFRRNHNETNVCVRPGCGRKFHPFRNVGNPSQRGTGEFCSLRCFLLSGRMWAGEMRKEGNCTRCGKDISKIYRIKYCEKCYKIVRNECSKSYYKARYHSDPEFRARKLAYSRAYSRERYRMNKEKK